MNETNETIGTLGNVVAVPQIDLLHDVDARGRVYNSARLFLPRLSAAIGEWRKSKDFDTPTEIDTNFGRVNALAKLALIGSECVGEAVEAVRDGNLTGDDKSLDRELADTIIRCLDLADALGIDIGEALQAKMLINEDRPRLHGRGVSV